MSERKRQARGSAALFLVVLAACGGGEAAQPAADAQVARRVVNVETQTARASSFTDVVNVIGIVEARRDVTIAAEEGGVIRALLVERGERVEAGQPIARIDDALLAAQVEQAEADAALARETFERQRRLWEEEQVGTELAYLQAKYGADRANANARLLRERLARTVVRAPVSGFVDARHVEVGAMVAAGTPVARLVDVSTLKVIAGVPERFAADIRPGASARVGFDVLPGRVIEGRLNFVGTAVDEHDRTFPIELVLDRAAASVKPGMIANVSIERSTLESAVVVPQEAVLRGEFGYIVYVAVDRGGETVAETRSVELGPSRQGQVVVTSGLEAGEAVVVVGQQKVAQGDLLQVVASRGEAES